MKIPEMVPIRYGRFVIDVPGGWKDDSTISFVAPPNEALAAPLSPRQHPSFSSNVHVTLELRPEGVDDPLAFLDRMRDGLLSAGAELSDVAPPGVFKMGGRDGALVERRVTLNNEAMRQLTAIVLLPENVIVASAATSESEIDRERPVLLEMLRRVRYE